MAFSSEPKPLPTASASGVPPNGGPLDLRRPQILLRVLPCFAFSFFACRFFTISLWYSFLLALAYTIGRSANTFFQLYFQPSSRPLKDVDLTLVPNASDGTKHKPLQEHKEVDERTVVHAPAPVQVEPAANEVIEISDSEDENKEEVIKIGDSDHEEEEKTYSSGQVSREVDNQESEGEGRGDSGQEADDVHTQQGSLLANDSSVDEGLDAQSPISITDEDESDLSSVTLVEPGSASDIPRPEFADECPRLKRKSDAPPPQPRPELPENLRHIYREYTFEDDFGWVMEAPKKRDSKALKRRIVDGFSETDKENGIVYILRHSLYENLYKVGCTKRSMEDRSAGFPRCIKGMAWKVHTTKEMRGFRRVEALAKLDMASRNVDMRICLPCLINEAKQKNTFHTEWFKGDLEEIKGCVEYWNEVVRASYVDDEFIGNVSEIANRGLSSRRLESAEDSARLREKLNASPSHRPKNADPAGQLDAGAHATGEKGAAAGEEDGCGEGNAGESGEPEEVCSGRGGMIWERQDTSDDRPFPTPEKRAVRRSPKPRKSVGAETPEKRAARRSPRLRKSSGADGGGSRD